MKENSERFSSPETTVIAIPSRILEQKPSRQMPKGIHDPDTPLVFIDRYSPDHATNHDNKLDNPDDYVFMVHYYQPDHPLLYLQVNITNGPTVEEDAVRRGGDQAGVPIGGDVTLQDVQVYLNFFGRNLCHHHYFQVLSPRSESCQAVARSLEATAAELNALQKTFLR